MSTNPLKSPDAPALDLANQWIERGSDRIRLTPKAFAVLVQLHRHAGQLVTKEALLEAVWPRVYVGEAVLKVTVREIRKALADDARAPRYLETVHRRGYRLIGTLRCVEPESDAATEPASGQANPPTPPPTGLAAVDAAARRIAGREDTLKRLSGALAQSLAGRRQLCFLVGEAGIGKTALADAWLAANAASSTDSGLVCATGACVQHYGTVEPYLAVLDALGRLARQLDKVQLLELLWQYAPGWLAQMPWLLDDQGRERLQRELFGSTRERMLRELTELIEALSIERPLVLVLEDLHWSDRATLDLIGYFATRAEPCRCLVIATFRPEELADRGHPLLDLHRELKTRERCETLHLTGLGRSDLGQALARQLRPEGGQISDALLESLRAYSGGNPLFLQSAVEDLLEAGELVLREGCWTLTRSLGQQGSGPPQRIRDILERQAERLDDSERDLLGAASLAREAISVAALAAMLESDPLDIEDLCDALSLKHGWLRPIPTQTQDPAPQSYALTHAVYRQYWADQVPGGRRRRQHLRLARHLAGVEDDAVGHPLAAEIAWHFGAAGDTDSALSYWQSAARIASARFAAREAAACLDEALGLLARCSASDPSMHLSLTRWRNALLAASGDLERAIPAYQEQARLAGAAQNQAELARACLGLATALFWIDRAACLRVAAEALSAARCAGDQVLEAHTRGWHAHWESIVIGYSDERAAAYETAVETARLADDAELECQHRALQAYNRISQSDYRGGCDAADTGLGLAERNGDAHNFLVCHFFKAWGLFHLGRWGEMRKTIASGAEMAAKNGHLPWKRHFDLQLAWLHTHAGDHAEARRLCEPVYEAAEASGLRNSEWLLGLILLTRLAVADRDAAGAERCLGAIDDQLREHPDAVDSVLRLPLQIVRIQYQHWHGAWAEAICETDRLLALAEAPRERTYCALAHAKRAELAVSAGDLDGAEEHVERALRLIESEDVPVAAWQVLSASALLSTARGDRQAAGESRRASALILARLARSLTASDPLRPSLRALVRSQAGLDRPGTEVSAPAAGF